MTSRDQEDWLSINLKQKMWKNIKDVLINTKTPAAIQDQIKFPTLLLIWKD